MSESWQIRLLNLVEAHALISPKDRRVKRVFRVHDAVAIRLVVSLEMKALRAKMSTKVGQSMREV